jgi:hypothetical protein
MTSTSTDAAARRRPTARTEELRALFERLSPVDTFTERQWTDRARGAVPTATEVDAALRRLVREMRERYGFRTSLDDDGLVAVVRAALAGRSDRETAADLGVSTDVVARARVHLHLFRESDRDPAFPRAAFREFRDGGASVADCATALDVGETAVRDAARLFDARAAARATGYRYPLRFAELLDVDADESVAAALRAERDLFSEVRD